MDKIFIFDVVVNVFHLDSNYLYVSIFQDSNVIYENMS